MTRAFVRREADGGLPQAHALEVPVRRETRDARERAHEVKRTEARFVREHFHAERRGRIVLDQPNRARDAALCVGRTARYARRSGGEARSRGGEADSDLFPRHERSLSGRGCPNGRCLGNERRKGVDRRNA